jgi:hypothetical protein
MTSTPTRDASARALREAIRATFIIDAAEEIGIEFHVAGRRLNATYPLSLPKPCWHTFRDAIVGNCRTIAALLATRQEAA